MIVVPLEPVRSVCALAFFEPATEFVPGTPHESEIVALSARSRLFKPGVLRWGGFYKETLMEVMHRCCCGIDVHKDTIVACVRRIDAEGGACDEVRTFGTTTAGILELGDWLAGTGVPIAAMESTGVYWKPLWNLLEGRMKLLLVNARDVRQVPGRKTDVKDSQWIAQLLSCGLLKASFVPDRPQRELRDLTRTRACVLQDKARVANRLQKTLEDANIKLGSVASDVLGASGRDMIRALIDGQMTPAEMADLARYRMRVKIPQLTQALRGEVNAHHRFMLRLLLDQVEHLEREVAQIDARIEAVLGPLEQAAVAILDEIPGIDQRAAENIVAEIGTDMKRFATAGHLACWAGICPGNHRSAGKRRSGRMMEGNRWLKATLNQCAWAASRKKDSYFAAQHRRLAARRGVKRATMAVAHSQLCVCWELLSQGTTYQDLGHDYFDRLNEEGLKRNLVRRLEKLGYGVKLEKHAAA
jgi:transposase